MSAEQNKATVRRFYEEVWNKGNVDFAFEVFAEDYIRHDLRPTKALPGPEGQRNVGNLMLSPPLPIIILAIGMVLFGVATLSAKVLPLWSRSIPLVLRVLLIPGFFLTFPGFVLDFPPFNSVHAFGLSGYFTFIAQGLGWVLLGYALWSERGQPIQQPARVR